MNTRPDKLFTRDYCLMLCANFMLYMGFYLLLPVLPFYLAERMNADNATIGVVLSCYTVAALCIRPFAGFLLDTFARKPLYLLAYGIFVLIFVGYHWTAWIALFVVFRAIHGLSFGMVTVAGSTIVIDVMPSARRGEGLGYYGMANNISMAVGPMLGLFLHDAYSFDVIFITALIVSSIGLVCAKLVRPRVKEPVARKAISLDRFVLLRGIPGGVALLMLSIPYGVTTTYIAMYGQELGIEISTGVFFSLMAIGIASSRVFSGKLVDKGYVTEIILVSIALTLIPFVGLAVCPAVAAISTKYVTVMFMACAAFIGIAFGVLFPAYNSFFVNLAPNSERGTAVSTYLTSWDLGIGAGLMMGGYVSSVIGFDAAYAIGAGLSIVSWLWFFFYVGPRYKREKLK